jgi:hypothetical protein
MLQQLNLMVDSHGLLTLATYTKTPALLPQQRAAAAEAPASLPTSVYVSKITQAAMACQGVSH